MTKNDQAARALYESHGADWLIARAEPSYTDALVALVLKHVVPGDRILDICCGYGRLMLPLLRDGFDVTGVDISEVLLQKGRDLVRTAGNTHERFVAGNLKALPVASGTFDFSFCVWASLNFLIDEAEQLQAVQEMHRILKPGGAALIECPVHDDDAAIQTVEVGDVSYEYQPLTIAGLESLAARSGFSSQDMRIEDVAGRPRVIALFQK